MENRTQFELPLYRVNASLYYFIYGDKESHISQLRNIVPCAERWTVNTHQNKVKANQTEPIVIVLFPYRFFFSFFERLVCCCFWLNEYARHSFFWSDAPSHHVWSCIERKLNLVCSHRSLAWIRYWYYWKLLLIVLLWFPMDFISFASLCFVCTVFAFVDDSECVFDELKQSSRSPGTQSTAYKMYQKARGNV